MTVLAEALDIGDEDLADAGDEASIVVDAPLRIGTFKYPFLKKLDDELVSVYSGADTTTWSIHRAQEGTLAAAHEAGTELLSPFGGSSAAGLSVDNGVDPPFAAATLVAPGATESAPGEATLTVPTRQKTTTLTDAQIKTLRDGDGIEIVPAPSAGQILDFVRIILHSDIEVAYEGVDAGAQLVVYLGPSQVAYINNASAFWDGQVTTLLDAGETVITIQPGLDIGDNPSGTGQAISADVPNSGALYLKLDQAANVTAGDPANTIKVTTLYMVVDL